MAGLLASSESTGSPPLGQRTVLPGVDWGAYQQISEALAGRHVRLCYSNGLLEFMTISPGHGRLYRLLAQFVVALTDETNRPRASYGDMTMVREDLEKGIEPDEAFYIDHEHAVRGKDHLDLAFDPPPDLGIEVDLASTSRVRLDALAALQVREIWRFAEEVVQILMLMDDGQYAETTHSSLFPFLTSAVLNDFLARRTGVSETQLISLFREWVRSADPDNT